MLRERRDGDTTFFLTVILSSNKIYIEVKRKNLVRLSQHIKPLPNFQSILVCKLYIPFRQRLVHHRTQEQNLFTKCTLTPASKVNYNYGTIHTEWSNKEFF